MATIIPPPPPPKGDAPKKAATHEHEHEHEHEREREDNKQRRRDNSPVAAQEELKAQRLEEANKLADDYEKEAEDDEGDFGPLSTQGDQVRRSEDMMRVGASNWVAATEAKIAERQGDPPPEPRQVHGVAPAQRPTR